MTHTAIARPVVVTAAPRPAPPARSSKAPDRPADRLSWLWLAVGLALLPFSTVHAELPLAAWLAPIFVMRFARTQPMRLGIPVVVVVGGVAMAYAWRDMFSFPIGSIIGLTYGLAFSLAYALDRLLSPRLRGVTDTRFPACSHGGRLDNVDLWHSRHVRLARLHPGRRPAAAPARVSHGHLGPHLPHSLVGASGQRSLGARF